MDKINMKQFRFTQPDGGVEKSTDKKYLDLANRLLEVWDESGLLSEVQDDLRKVVALGLTGYFQDVMCDTGLWRSFTDECLRRYGRRVPFHADSEDYILYELNRDDIEFLLWYLLAFNSMQFRFLYPLDSRIISLAGKLFEVMESAYDTMEAPEGYAELFDVENHNPEDAEKLYELSRWLYWKSWLLLPPMQLTFAQIYPQMMEIQESAPSPQAAAEQIEKLQQQVMSSIPTGPLALYLREWLSLILDGKLPREKAKRYVAPGMDLRDPDNPKEHPWYTAFMAANAGRPIAYFATYAEMNRFLIEGLGWAEGEEHLDMMKEHSDFVLMVTPHAGLMVAKNIARCIADPDNSLYDRNHARNFAFNLISQRAVCPGDMLRYISANDWLPDVAFPEYPLPAGSEETPGFEDRNRAALDNLDFLARAYLQEYYRGD